MNLGLTRRGIYDKYRKPRSVKKKINFVVFAQRSLKEAGRIDRIVEKYKILSFIG